MALSIETTKARRLPVSIYQQGMIEAACDPSTSDGYHQHMTIRWGFRVRPGLPLRTLKRAFDKLVARHESLRLQFIEHRGEWKAEVLEKHPTGVIVEDLTALSEKDQAATIQARASAPMTALSNPMFEMILFKCGAAGDVLVTRAQHAIIDGFSVRVLIEDLLKSIFHMPVLGNAPSHIEYVTYCQKKLNEQAEEKQAFWHQHLVPPPAELTIGRYAKGLPAYGPENVGPSIRLDKILSDSQTEKLTRVAKEIGQSAFSLYCAAFSEALCQLAGQDEVLMNYVVGRHDREMSGFVGVVVGLGMMKYTCDKPNLEERARWVGQTVSAMSQKLPSATLSAGGAVDTSLRAYNTQRRRFLVHQTNVVSKQSSSPFSSLFNKALDGTITLGHVSFDRVELPGDCETEFELYLLIDPQKEGLNAHLIADAAGYNVAELDLIAHLIVEQLGLAANSSARM